MLGLYYLATIPQRKHSAAQRKSTGREPVISLLYHRVSDHHPNTWTISKDRFRAQIEWLQERFEFVSLAESQRRMAAEENSRPTVALTFDDGYSENCEFAIPWLLERDIPLTYFVSVQQVASGNPFPHDVACNCPLPPNTLDELKEMAAKGVEIGSHTMSHLDLGKANSPVVLYEEIAGSKHKLETLLGVPVHYFAFPYGLPDNMSTECFEFAFQAGYWGVCSAYGGYNLPGCDSFHIQRIHGDPQWSRFLNWLTIDPRKLNRKIPFSPGHYRDRF
jgi:peptidoglycan/xylan/chitin deacetylase (PgdA/CDA1 family)